MEKLAKIENNSLTEEPLSPIKEEKETINEPDNTDVTLQRSEKVSPTPLTEPAIIDVTLQQTEKLSQTPPTEAANIDVTLQQSEKLSQTPPIEEILILESSRSEEFHDKDDTQFWRPDLMLTEQDKIDIIDNKKIVWA